VRVSDKLLLLLLMLLYILFNFKPFIILLYYSIINTKKYTYPLTPHGSETLFLSNQKNKKHLKY